MGGALQTSIRLSASSWSWVAFGVRTEEQGKERLFTEDCPVILSVTLRSKLTTASIPYYTLTKNPALKHFENDLSVPKYSMRQVLLSPLFTDEETRAQAS